MQEILIVEGRNTDLADILYPLLPGYNLSNLIVAPNKTECQHKLQEEVNYYFDANSSPDIVLLDTLAEHAIPIIRKKYKGPIIGIESCSRNVMGADETVIVNVSSNISTLEKTIDKYLKRV